MKPATKARILKLFRVTHSWLGFLVFPWIFVIGLTGFYLNHEKVVNSWLATASYDEAQFADWPNASPVLLPTAREFALTIWPDEALLKTQEDSYHGFNSFIFRFDSGRVIVTQDTGHYYIKTSLTRTTFAPDGSELHHKIYWSSVFKWLHVRGWLNNSFGTWLADIVSVSMAVFALSGAYLFWAPRGRRWSRRLRKLARKPQ